MYGFYDDIKIDDLSEWLHGGQGRSRKRVTPARRTKSTKSKKNKRALQKKSRKHNRRKA